MPDWNAALRRPWVRRLLGLDPTTNHIPLAEGLPRRLDGAAAVALMEAAVAPEASHGPADLARAVGLALGGRRATAVLDPHGSDRASLAAAASQSLPLLAYLGLEPGGTDVAPTAAGHHSWHAAAGSGAVTLVAADTQQVIDFAVLGRQLAEQALTPVVIALDPEIARQPVDVELPAAALLRELLGRPEELIHPPDEAQRLIFGRHRRRVPRWHDSEQPTAAAGPASAESFAAAVAARSVYLRPGLRPAFDRACQRLAERTGRDHGPVSRYRLEDAEVAVVAMGTAIAGARALADHLAERPAKERVRLGVLGLHLLSPFPDAEMVEALTAAAQAGVAHVAVLERTPVTATLEGPLTQQLQAAVGRVLGGVHERGSRAADAPTLHSVLYGLGGTALQAADLEQLVRRLLQSRATTNGKRKRSSRPATEAAAAIPRFLGLDLAPDLQAHPKRQATIDALLRSYPDAAPLGLRATTTEPAATTALPAAARRLHQHSPHQDQDDSPLPDFRSRIATPDLIPDPYLALGLEPPLSASLRPPRLPDRLPALDSSRCTGSGACWSVCPEAAIHPAVFSAKALLELGLRRASEAGKPVTPLRMVLGALASGLETALRENPGTETNPGATAGPLLDAALGSVLETSPLPAERKQLIREAFPHLRDEVATLQLGRTARFFDAPFFEGIPKPQLFSLAIDPDACTACGLCIAACKPEALNAAPLDAGRASLERTRVDLLNTLPPLNTDALAQSTLEQPALEPRLDPLAAALLPADHRRILAATGAEAGSGEAIAVRQVLGAASACLLPRRRQWNEQLDELRDELAAAIHRTLEGALPDSDLDALARGLDALAAPQAELAQLSAKVEAALEQPQVDIPHLRRLVTAARQLADFADRWRRAPVPWSAVVAAGSLAEWSGRFPYNVFASAVSFAGPGEVAALARGVAEAQMTRTGEVAALLRHARTLLDDASTVKMDDPIPLSLPWQQLSSDERHLCPPLFVLAAEASLRPGEFEALLALQSIDAPIKLLLLADLRLGLPATDHDTLQPPQSIDLDPMPLLLGRAHTALAQTSIAHPQHLVASVETVLRHPGTAVLRLYAPSPSRHGFAPEETLCRAREAVTSRVFPLFQREAGPGSALSPGPVFSGPFSTLRLHASTENGDLEADETLQAAVHWAQRQQRFAAYFAEQQPTPELTAALQQQLTTSRLLHRLSGPAESVQGAAQDAGTADGADDPLRHEAWQRSTAERIKQRFLSLMLEGEEAS